MNLKLFYDATRKSVDLTPANISGFDRFLTEGERQHTPLNIFAYILATVYWETAHTMQPVKEAYWVYPHDPVKMEAWRKRNLRYYPYYGRSFPQFTWEKNYRTATDVWNSEFRGDGPKVNFVTDPDRIMDPAFGVPLTFHALRHGWFTGKGLDDFIDLIDEGDQEDLREFKNARKAVNGTDKAEAIGRVALLMEAALKAAGYKH